MILKGLFLSDGDSDAADTARKIVNCYDQKFVPSDPLIRFRDDKGIQPFLFVFWQAVFIAFARIIPYNDSNQEKLLRFILELQKLPPRQFKIWEIASCEPTNHTLEDHWNGFYPYDTEKRGDGDGEDSFEEVCDKWVKFSSFLARLIEAGLIGDYYKCARLGMSEGLDEDLPHGPKRDYNIMVAAQYILLAGGNLAKNCYEKDGWRRRAEKLKEISKDEGSNIRLASAMEEAHKYMVSLHPEIFLTSED